MNNTPQLDKNCPFAVFNLSFRVFFLGAIFYGAFAMFIWFLQFAASPSLIFNLGNASQWHAHEMVFGFSLAVIAGFTLTAVKNWTDIQTPYGLRLCLLFLTWALARVSSLTESFPIWLPMLFDLIFNFWLTYEFARPVILTKQWKQMSLVSKVFLLGVFNLVYYLGLLGIISNGVQIGLTGGLLIAISLVITMARRIIGFFIEKGVEETFSVKNYRWVDIAGLWVFLAWGLLHLFSPYQSIAAWLSFILFALHSIRLWGWYHRQIWQKPLLSSLYVGYAFITLGFLIFALSAYFSLPVSLAYHAFAIGGLGLIILGMMSRVSLGHTGNNVFEPPKILYYLVPLLILTATLRILLPLFLPQQYTLWILLSQLGWILVFSLLLIAFWQMLTQPRQDGHFG